MLFIFLRAHALPYFDFFLDPDQVIEILVCGEKDNRGITSIPGLDIGPAVEYALCFGNLGIASAILRRRADLLGSLIGNEREQRFQAMTQAGMPRSVLDGPGFHDEIETIKRYWLA